MGKKSLLFQSCSDSHLKIVFCFIQLIDALAHFGGGDVDVLYSDVDTVVEGRGQIFMECR